jgi:hypothetical protein
LIIRELFKDNIVNGGGFDDQYKIVHRLENVELRNLAKFFVHLLVTGGISWGVCIHF